MRSFPVGLVGLLLAAACGDDSGVAATDLGATHDGPIPCSDKDPPAGSVCPVRVTGTLGTGGVTPVGATVSVCAGLCFFGETDATGKFTVTADTHLVLSQYAFEVHGRPEHATYYTALPAGTTGMLAYASPLPWLALPAPGPTIAAEGAQTLTAGDVTITLPAATKVLFSVEDFGVANGHALRALSVPPTQVPFVDAGKPPVALYALAPFEASFSEKAALSIANGAGLAPGAAVEVQVQAGLLNDQPPAGRWLKAAVAHVSLDGARIETDPGEGITELTWIALTTP